MGKGGEKNLVRTHVLMDALDNNVLSVKNLRFTDFDKIHRRAGRLTGENLKVVWAEFSTLS